MITTIAKQFSFDAAHCIPTFPEHHKCHRLHGHTYHVELQFTGTTDQRGLCAGIDYGDVAEIWARVHERLDHRYLNDVPGLEVPTTENLVVWIARVFIAACDVKHVRMSRAFTKIRVSESSSTWCELLVGHEVTDGL